MLWARQHLLAKGKTCGSEMGKEKKPDLKKILLQKDTEIMVLFKNEKGEDDMIYLNPKKLAGFLP